MGTSSAWTEERKARQRQRVREWAPWRYSTGPKSSPGKARSSRNAEAFRSNPEMRRAWLLIEQFLRDGRMTPELGEILLANELSAASHCDTILADASYGCEELELGATVADDDLAALADIISDDADYDFDELELGPILAESDLSPVLLDIILEDAAFARDDQERGADASD